MDSPEAARVERQHLLVFGDQTVEKLTSIQSLVRHARTSPAAKRFLQEATDVLQLEFSKPSAFEHGWTKGFDTLLGLAEENAELQETEETNPMVATLLMCIGRLGDLIVRAEQDPSILGSSAGPVQVLGFCTGLLPASVAVAARDTSELFSLGREVIAVTFRMALEVVRRMMLVEAGYGTWARTYVGLTEARAQEIVDEFHRSQNIPTPRRIAVGVVSKGWVTLLGAPSSLARLSEWSSEIQGLAHVKTDAGGPIHNPHLPPIDVDYVLDGCSPAVRNRPLDWAKARLLSPSLCQEYRHVTYGELLGDIVKDIVHNVLRVSETIDACLGFLVSGKPIAMAVIGPTGHQPAVEQALRAKGHQFQIVPCESTDKGGEEPATAVRSRGAGDLVAIVGMAGRFPGSDSVEGLWEDLQAGRCHIKEVPKSRFDLDDFYDATGEKPNSTTARHGAWLDEPGLFDHKLFNISPREAGQMDPIVRLLLACSYEALQSSGYSPNGTLATASSRIATYFGQAGDDWHEILNNEGVDIYYVPSLSKAFAPSRLNYTYKWGGGSFSLDNACATSTTAISLACSALLSRECDMALTGGGSVMVSPNAFSGLSKAGMISSTGGCRTYHDDADGYARGEGVAVVVLKRFEDAMADNDNILGVIRASARTYSDTAPSITHPSRTSQERIYHTVLRQAGLDASEIAYVEMHGTGTQAGDLEEMMSVTNVMGRHRTRDNPLTVGAVKAAMGHGEAVAGVTSLIKVLMMMRDRIVPPQPGWPFDLNRNFPPLDKMNVRIATSTMKLKAAGRNKSNSKIIALVNSFDASGGNTSLVVEEPPTPAAKTDDPREGHVVAVSGRTTASLRMNQEKLVEYLMANPDTKLADLAYTTTARRMHETLRVAYVGRSTREIEQQLRKHMDANSSGSSNKKIKNIKSSSRVFLFTGQGSQYAGMGADLFRSSKPFAELIMGYQAVATSMGLPSFIDIIANRDVDMGTQRPTSVQLALVALEMAMAHTLRTWGVVPDVVIGHSLGEYAALNAAGVLSVSDVLYLVGRRGMLMEKRLVAGAYAMLATSVDADRMRDTLKTRPDLASCEVACINAPSITVISGTVEDVKALQAHLQTARGADGAAIRATLLHVSYGFHSAQLDPILDDFQKLAKGVVFSKPEVPIISTLTAALERGTGTTTFSPAHLARQAREPVDFHGSLKTCAEAGFVGDNALLIEIGPDPVGLGLARRTLELPPSARLLPTLKSSEENWCTISGVLKAVYETGGAVDWPEFHKNFKGSLRLLDLPKYAFDNKNFWTPYVQPVMAPAAAATSAVPPKATEKFSAGSSMPTPSLQRIESEELKDDSVTTTYASDTSDPYLLKAISGHVVNGQQICPLGVFCDMALTAATHAYRRLHKAGKAPVMSIGDIDITNAVVIVPGRPQPVIRATSTYVRDTGSVAITFSSTDGAGKETTTGTCKVLFEDKDSKTKAHPLSSQTQFLLKSRMETLREEAKSGKAHRMLKPVVYKLFSGVVAYSEAYRALEEVILDGACQDAIGRVRLTSLAELGGFLFDPYGVDAVSHLAGFVLNSGLKYPDDVACISLGFSSWRSFKPLDRAATYTSYVCMQELGAAGGHGAPMISGDCYVFDQDNELVQLTQGIRFQKLTKKILSVLFGAPIIPAAISRPAPSLAPAAARVETNSKTGTTTSNSNGMVPSAKEETVAAPENDVDELLKTVLEIVSSESGTRIEDMDDDAAFADLGVDSLMAITIMATIKAQTGLDLEAAFFLEQDTVGKAKNAFLERYGPEITEESATATAPHHTPNGVATIPATTPSPPPEEFDSPLSDAVLPLEHEHGANQSAVPRAPPSPPASIKAVETNGTEHSTTITAAAAKLVHIQGSRAASATRFFLLADAGGTTLSYLQLPSLGPSLCVYGVESPFAKNPLDLADTITVPDLADMYAAAIRAEQPAGPYLLGGMAVGAILAHAVADRLASTGDKIGGLLLLDPVSPPASATENSAGATPNTNGTGSTGKSYLNVKPQQAEHAKRLQAALARYQPVPLASSLLSPGKAVAILATGKGQGTDDVMATEQVWKKLVPGLECRQIDAESGPGLWKFPTINVFGQMCKEAVGEIRE